MKMRRGRRKQQYTTWTSEEIDYTVDKCPECGADVDVKHECKMVIDTPKIVKATKKQIKSSKGKCKNNNHKINTMPKGYTKGSMFGPNLMTMIVFMFFTTLGLNSISHMLTLVGVPKVSKVTIMNALAAVAREKFAATAKQISKNLAKTRYLMGDETPVKIGIKRGYALGVHRRIWHQFCHYSLTRCGGVRYTLSVI